MNNIFPSQKDDIGPFKSGDHHVVWLVSSAKLTEPVTVGDDIAVNRESFTVVGVEKMRRCMCGERHHTRLKLLPKNP